MNENNFLHENPGIYDVFERDHDLTMARFILDILLAHGIRKGRVLDVGSGLGREAGYLKGKGYDTVGIDLSEEMIEWARAHYPDAEFIHAEQAAYDLRYRFDAVYCVGSTFLYNYTRRTAAEALRQMRKHCRDHALLYLDMRNAMFFSTEEGQAWLREPLEESAIYQGKRIRLKTRYSLNCREQMLVRNYNWEFEDGSVITEVLRHRLFYPKEMEYLVEQNGFAVERIFDEPAPHIARYDGGDLYGETLRGRRMQILARAK